MTAPRQGLRALVAVAAGMGLLLIASGCSDQDKAKAPAPPRPVSAMQVGVATALGQRQFPGLAKAAQEAMLAFRVSGQIASLPVRVGQRIEAGTIVATLDESSYLSDVTRLQADLDQANADLQMKSDQYERVMPLVKSGTYPKARGDDALSAREGAAARVQSVRSALRRAQIDLEQTVLKAPFEGRVVAVYPEVFEEIRAQQQIVRLLDMRRLEAVIDVPETLITLVPLVGSIEARFDAYPGLVLKGEVVEIGTEASQLTRTFPVTIAMDQSSDAKFTILPGMAGSFRVASVNEGEAAKQIVVPPIAVRPLEPGKAPLAVWVVDPATDKVALRPIEVGRVVQGGIQVTQGLKAGEWVVTAGANSLTDGEIVRLPDEAAEPAKPVEGSKS
ncbi:efflux RND transporter periplasmic adaptor subunit [Kaistia dalseonensis]|uniref:RND family efflux transporter MFP subunit n=1 Tax=Kaistia dalseonensis TaxID=410840 RepID=A0ABU0H416_9HYPH|nr:efflux RND transporter periplasmic adaptor subunit [Kaistia dalseonensis]MCX5494446.1 efflux RND transporter periplasmic adaptor subunit [Kaistia dalseonensis]MDQ0437025.1 RND family efflux transporter MFP subunit [Kaistia dalseonensis]